MASIEWALIQQDWYPYKKEKLGCINRHKNEETVETVTNYFWGSKITADGDAATKLKDAYSLEGKL